MQNLLIYIRSIYMAATTGSHDYQLQVLECQSTKLYLIIIIHYLHTLFNYQLVGIFPYIDKVSMKSYIKNPNFLYLVLIL